MKRLWKERIRYCGRVAIEITALFLQRRNYEGPGACNPESCKAAKCGFGDFESQKPFTSLAPLLLAVHAKAGHEGFENPGTALGWVAGDERPQLQG